jgi:hypothetical protein
MQAWRFLPCLDSVQRHAGIAQHAMPAYRKTARRLAPPSLPEKGGHRGPPLRHAVAIMLIYIEIP